MVAGVGGGGEAALLAAARVIGIGGGDDLGEVAPSAVGDAVVLIGFSPAMPWAGGVSGSGERGDDAI